MQTKALLLAAGFGTRLRPITEKVPKCLVKIKDQPILENWLRKLENVGIKEVLINKHYLSEKVEEFIEKRNKTNLKITQVYEDKLNGTAGTLIKNKLFFKNSNILFIHVDNYTKSDLTGLLKTFSERPKNCLITMLTFKSKDPQNCGVVEVNKHGVVKSFHEKISNPPTDIANGAIYLFNYKLIDWIINKSPNAEDFSCDVLPLLIDKINTWQVDDYFLDIGTPKNLELANKLL